MASALDDLFANALALPEEDRAELGRLLLESLDLGETDDGVGEAWGREIDRRVADINAGRAKTIEWEELRARLHARASRP